MNKIFKILMLSLVMPAFSQDITILKPAQSYSSKDTMIVMTVPRFNRLDSIINAYKFQISNYQKDSTLYAKNLVLSDSIQKMLRLEMDKNTLLVTRDQLYLGIDSLRQKNIETYQKMVTDLQAAATKGNSTGGFFNNTFWFGTGAVVGVVAMYLSSEIVQHIK
jgi:hypothetical protein